MHPNSGLILTRNIVPGCQIRSLIEYDDKNADIVLSDLDAYTSMNQQNCHFLICDIDDVHVQGIAVAEWFRYRFQGAPWYAICRHGNSRNMRLAREKGADGYFFLTSSGLALDPHAGMTHTLLHRRCKKIQSARHYMPRLSPLHPTY
jgi:DNA-binding NarL/FixJ family response regulator